MQFTLMVYVDFSVVNRGSQARRSCYGSVTQSIVELRCGAYFFLA